MAKKDAPGDGSGGWHVSDGFLISKIIVHPSRKIGLPKYSSVDVSAGMEVVFDKPQPVGSPLIQQAFDEVHEVLKKEFRKQVELFGSKEKAEQQA